MTDSFIPQMQPWFGEEEKRAVCSYMDEGGFITEFRRTERFEAMIAEFTKARHCVVVNNGTVSLTLAALAVGLQRGDEVLVPNFTMIATANAVQMIGAVPVFVDVEPTTLCMDVELARKAITGRTRAIMLVAANGRFPSAGIGAFESLARDHDLILIEDSAQALGSRYPDGRHVGRVGVVGSFSFSAPKIISTGQGGALITDDDAIDFRLRRLKDFGRAAGGTDIHDSIGYNFKFTELQACVGIEQMKKLQDRIERKRQIAQRYVANLQGLSTVTLFEHDFRYTVPWFIDSLVVNRSALQEHLKQRGIGTRVMYPPVNQQLAYNLPGHYPVSMKIGEQGLWLPSATQLTPAEVDRICNEIRAFYTTSS